MLPHQAPAPQSPRRVGVGIDTSRYGHYAAFLREDQQPAADEPAFAESAAGYAQLRQRLERLAQRHGAVTFVVRLDAAGPYADNLRHSLQHLGPSPESPAGAIPNAGIILSCGDPQRNQNYRAALFGSKKAARPGRAAPHDSTCETSRRSGVSPSCPHSLLLGLPVHPG
jgi:hypothetical protein